MLYTNKCTVCSLIEDEQRPMADYNKPSPCTACGEKTRAVLTGTKIKPFPEGPNGGKMR